MTREASRDAGPLRRLETDIGPVFDQQAGTAWADALAEEIQASFPGVQLELGLDRGPYLVLFRISLPESERGKGLGTRVMERILAEADLGGVPVTLSPSSRLGGDLDRLHAFYQRFGFIANTSRGELHAAKESMVRAPANPAAVSDLGDRWDHRHGRWGLPS
ncbi:GNAT family N-acetyltransferase [Streptomyces sp. NPDC127063]|uniref:GNAT family N-acetyltransferase n=1 Tax=Streptomyces sp. NPDC127063 TaxID=3347123 RepID=UPI00364B8FC6